MQILVINSGSSSVKFQLYSVRSERRLVSGEVSRIGSDAADLRVQASDAAEPCVHVPVRAPDHSAAMRIVLDALRSASPPADLGDIVAVGHRIVHGGTRFTEPVEITDDVFAGIKQLELLAPVHTKGNLAGVVAAREALPGVCHIAVFDTAFHATIPPEAREYALPRDLARRYGIRRYGFHGTSHGYVASRAAGLLGKPLSRTSLITMHLGNGASACAIRNGISVDTSMGMTPLEGLVMGTRCGDVDPAIPGLIGELTGASREEVNATLNFESGLKGLCGENDLREVHARAQSGDADAALALDIYCYRAKKYVGAYLAVLGSVDAIVFTAGVGENDAEIRGRICGGLEWLGVRMDHHANHAAPASGNEERFISTADSPIAVIVIPTDEEREIAKAAYACLDHATIER